LLKEDDKHLFRTAVDGVRPLRTINRKIQTPPSGNISYQSRLTRPDKDEVFLKQARTNSDIDIFQRPGVQRQLLKKLRRGQLPIQAELDLHGYTQQQAEVKLHAFISDCLARRLRQIRIIHGKGKGSEEGKPVLRTHTRCWLQCCSAVLAYASPPARFGGKGVVDVIIKRTH